MISEGTGRMEPKTFRAPSITEALEQVQNELGPEALVVSVREAPNGPAWQVWRSHAVEVVAMAGSHSSGDVELLPGSMVREGNPEGGSGMPMQHSPSTQSQSKTQPTQDLVMQVESLQHKIHSLTREMNRLSHDEWSKALSGAFQDLLNAGVDEAIARKIALVTVSSLGAKAIKDPRQVRKHLMQQMQAGIKVRSEAALAKDRIICAIGARGVGKTTALAKMAHRAVQEGTSVLWICASTRRMGAIPEAHAIGETLGIDVGLAYTPSDLAELIAESGSAELVLVDTSGCNPYREHEVLALGAMLTAIPARVTYVVAAATAKDQDLQRLQAMAAPFNPSGLVLTKLDESFSAGCTFNLAWRSQWPLAYFTKGPHMLEGFQRASAAKLAYSILCEGGMA